MKDFVEPRLKAHKDSTARHIQKYRAGDCKRFENAYKNPSSAKRAVYGRWAEYAETNNCKTPMVTAHNDYYFSLVFENSGAYFVITPSRNYIVRK